MTKPKHYTIYFFDHSAWKYMFLGFIIGSQVEINFRFQRCFFLWAPFAKTTSTSPQNCCSSCQVLLYSILCLILFHQIQHEPDTPYFQPLSNIHANANISTHNQTRPIISKAFTENPKDHHIRKITVVFWHSITRNSFTLYVEGKVEYFNHQ